MNNASFAHVLLPFVAFVAVACGTRDAPPPAASQTRIRDTALAARTPAVRPEAGDTALVVTEGGVGAIHVGMTMAQVSAALGTELKGSVNQERQACDQVNVLIRSKRVLLMFVDGQVARLDIVEPGISTREGAQVGDDETRINTLYAGRVQTAPHKYTDGHYLTVTPSTPGGSEFRLIFETDGKNVTRYRAGKLPEVAWVEGCS